MAWTFINSTSGFLSDVGTTLDADDVLNIATGDLVAVICAWEDGTSTVSVQSTAADNAMTMLATSTDTSNYVALGYKISATANAASTFRMTNGTARGYRCLGVMQFRPDAGDVVTFAAGPSPGSGNSATLTTGNISPAGTDLVVVAGGKDYTSSAFTDEKIATLAATGSEDILTFGGIWYKLFTSDQTNINGSSTVGSNLWVGDIMAFESSAGGGGLSIPVVMAYYQRLRDQE